MDQDSHNFGDICFDDTKIGKIGHNYILRKIWKLVK